MFHRESCPFVDYIIPVDIVDTITIAICPCGTILGRDSIKQGTVGSLTNTRTIWSGVVVSHDLLHSVFTEEHTLSTVCLGIIHPSGIVDRVHHVFATNQITKLETVVIVYRHFAFSTTILRGDQDDTERCTRSIDRRGCGILQYRDALDILWVHGVDIALHTVYQDKW